MNALSWVGAWLQQAVTENLGLKVMALVLSLGLFGYIHAQEDVMERTVPVSVISVPPVGGDRELMSRIPPSIHITLRASARSIADLLQKGITPVEVDLREGSPESVEFTRDMFLLPRDVELVLVDPPRLDLEWEGIVTRQVPLEIKITGVPAEGRVVKGAPRIEPERVIVRGPDSVVGTMQFAELEPYVVTGLTEGTWARRIAIKVPPDRARILGVPAATVTVDVVRELATRVFTAREVVVVGAVGAHATPRTVDVTVVGPPDLVSALDAEQVVPLADLGALPTSTAGWVDGKPPMHGSVSVPLRLALERVTAETQPARVAVRW